MKQAEQGLAVAVREQQFVAANTGFQRIVQVTGADLVGRESARGVVGWHMPGDGLEEQGNGGQPLLAIDEGRRALPGSLGGVRRRRGDGAQVVIVDGGVRADAHGIVPQALTVADVPVVPPLEERHLKLWSISNEREEEGDSGVHDILRICWPHLEGM